MLKKLWEYLNPMKHLGERKYPLVFPFLSTVSLYILLELFGFFILKHPDNIGNIIIFVNFALVLYFSFRSAIKGGLIVVSLSAVYYTYFLLSRHAPIHTKEMAAFIAGLLTLTNLLIVLIVGWHRKALDDLLRKEIEAKQKAEHEQKRWKTLMEQLPVGVMIATAPNGEIITRNDLAIDLLGSAAKPTKSIQDYRTFHATIQGRKLTANDWPLAKALTKGKVITGQEIHLNSKGKPLILFCNAAPVYDAYGKIIAAVTTFYDITKQKQLEKQKDDFIAMASHELKTPLTSAKIYIQALLRDSGKKTKIAEKINDQVNILSNLISTMVDVTLLEQGKLHVRKEPFILKTFALKTLANLQDTTNRKLKIDWQTNEYFYGNKERIMQVFTNLITNAFKFSPAESEVIVRSRKKKGDVVISIQDFGVGLSAGEQKHIFKRFYQSQDHKTYPGLGLGLYISNQIVKQIGGKMWVESKKAKGSTFYFSLPVAK